MQQDPYQQFPSPYSGMGNDPVNNIDPDGGWGIPCPGTSSLAIFLSNVGSAITTTLSAASPALRSIASIGLSVTITAGNVDKVIQSSNYINGQITTSEVGGNNSGDQGNGILIAKSRVDGRAGQDGHEDYSGNIKGFEKRTETDLEESMFQLIYSTTSANKEMRAVAYKMTRQFWSNTGGEFSDPALDKAVSQDENFIGFANNIFARFNEQLKNANGDISKFKPFEFNNPAFNRSENYSDGLGITIHGVSYVEVHLDKFNINLSTGRYSVSLKFDLYDNFGLDEDDISGGIWWNPLSWYHFNEGLKAWWLLQHKFGLKHLQTHVTIDMKSNLNVNDTYKIK